jgi:DNA-damage-inducible protein J
MSSVVHVEIDEKLESEATAVLEAMGLTMSEAVRLMMLHIAVDKALPFEPFVPNAETIEAMEAVERGELITVGSVDELLSSLNADD